MRKAQRWRYYCDHCKKAGGSSFHMQRHERGCTNNPNRVCGLCLRLGVTAAPLPELIALIREIGKPEYNEYIDINWLRLERAEFERLRERAANCPCCILAALRQANANVADGLFDFKAERKSAWERYDDDEYQERVNSHHYDAQDFA